jgi:site-specific DNA recombinase
VRRYQQELAALTLVRPDQVWSKQRKDEVLIDVDDVALGHTTKLRWNESAAWIWSEKIVHPPIIDHDIFEQVQVMASGRATNPARHKPHRAQHPYALRGYVWCGVCGQRMQSYWANAVPYCRCRFPAEYALANHVEHPLSVSLREEAIIGHIGRWLALEFAPAPSRPDDSRPGRSPATRHGTRRERQ